MRFGPLSALIVALSLPGLAHAITCDALKAEIEARYKAGGLASVSLVVLAPGDVGTAQVVGSCENGSKRIVRTGAPVAARKDPATPIATECKEGFGGPDCKERLPAPRR